MKKILFVFTAAVVLMMATGCKKEHQCRCVATGEREDGSIIPDDGTLKVFVVEGINCEDIKEMSFEERYATDSSISVHHVEVLKVTCRDYGD